VPGFDVGAEFPFVGRTFEEYRRLFGLNPATLAGRHMLGCPGGPSSFTAVANSLGADALAELCQVAHQVRVFLLALLDRERLALVGPVVEALCVAGVDCSFRGVAYEFQPDVSTALVYESAGVSPSLGGDDSQALYPPHDHYKVLWASEARPAVPVGSARATVVSPGVASRKSRTTCATRRSTATM
jgi:hypothetical protein